MSTQSDEMNSKKTGASSETPDETPDSKRIKRSDDPQESLIKESDTTVSVRLVKHLEEVKSSTRLCIVPYSRIPCKDLLPYAGQLHAFELHLPGYGYNEDDWVTKALPAMTQLRELTLVGGTGAPFGWNSDQLTTLTSLSVLEKSYGGFSDTNLFHLINVKKLNVQGQINRCFDWDHVHPYSYTRLTALQELDIRSSDWFKGEELAKSLPALKILYFNQKSGVPPSVLDELRMRGCELHSYSCIFAEK